MNELKEIVLPLPPLAEQKVIANKLDTLLAQVESTKTRLERIPQILKRFRQSVLAAAVSGKLTEEWRSQHTVDSTSLVEQLKAKNNHKPKPYEPSQPPYEIDVTWTWVRLGDVFSLKSGTTVKAWQELDVGDIPYFKVGDMNSPENIYFMQKPMKYVSSDSVSKKSLLSEGSIVFPKRGGAISTNKKRVLKQESLVDLNTMGISTNDMSVEYIYHWFSTIDLSQLNTGSTIPQINNGDIEPLWVPIPPESEQAEIVRRVKQLFAYADTIEQQVQNALARVNNLTQSILAKAFRGELTEQWRKDNPELISGDNSAEALLEKIKAEREAIKPEKKTQVRNMTA